MRINDTGSIDDHRAVRSSAHVCGSSRQPVQHTVTTFLKFVIADGRFGIRIDDIQEIVRAVRITRLPKAPPVVEGLVDYRGVVIPILDIRSRFRLPPKPVEPADDIVIARARGRLVGLRVDRALDVLALPDHDIDDVSIVAPASEYVAGVAKLPDGLLLIHDLATFLSDAEALALTAVMAEGLPS